MKPFGPTDYVRVSEAAELLGYSRQTVSRLMDNGRLEGFQLSRHGWRKVSLRSLVALMAQAAKRKRGR